MLVRFPLVLLLEIHLWTNIPGSLFMVSVKAALSVSVGAGELFIRTRRLHNSASTYESPRPGLRCAPDLQEVEFWV